MREIDRTVCVALLEYARNRIKSGREYYVCHAVEKSTEPWQENERDFILELISRELEYEGTLANWISNVMCVPGFHYSDQGEGMRETRLAWIDDMIRRFKL